MLTPTDVERLNDVIQTLDREVIAYQLRHFQCRFPIDFSPEFLASEPLGRLRHILFGLCLHNQKMIDVSLAA